MDTTLMILGLLSGFAALGLYMHQLCISAPIVDENELPTLHSLHGRHVPVHVTEPSGVIRQYLFDCGTGSAMLESRIPSPFVFRMNPFRRKDNKRRVPLRLRAAWAQLMKGGR